MDEAIMNATAAMKYSGFPETTSEPRIPTSKGGSKEIPTYFHHFGRQRERLSRS